MMQTYDFVMESINRLYSKFTGFVSYITEQGTPCSVPLSLCRVPSDSNSIKFICMTDINFEHSLYLRREQDTTISVDNMQMKCLVRCGGRVVTNEHAHIIKEYYPDNWQRYGGLPRQICFIFTVYSVKGWEYSEGVPYQFFADAICPVESYYRVYDISGKQENVSKQFIEEHVQYGRGSGYTEMDGDLDKYPLCKKCEYLDRTLEGIVLFCRCPLCNKHGFLGDPESGVVTENMSTGEYAEAEEDLPF